MKALRLVAFDPIQCRKEIDALQSLLSSKPSLNERDDLLPLFKKSKQMAAFIGTVIGIAPVDRIASEFSVFGNYSADLVIGNSERAAFCAVELEDAGSNSVLAQVSRRAQKEWGARLEHGFGQLIDWFFSFDDMKKTDEFEKHFGSSHVEFYGMLVAGRSADLTDYDRKRLRWRSDRVAIDSHKIVCLTYDDLLAALHSQWQTLSMMSQSSQSTGT